MLERYKCVENIDMKYSNGYNQRNQIKNGNNRRNDDYFDDNNNEW